MTSPATTSSPAPTTPERFLVAKELAVALAEVGIAVSYDYALQLIRDCPKSVRRQLRISDALAFLNARPDYKPHARRRAGVQ